MNRMCQTDIPVMTRVQKREQLAKVTDRAALEREFRALGTSGTAMVLGQHEDDVIRAGFTLTTDMFLKSVAAANN